jgi:Fibronectin type III domain
MLPTTHTAHLSPLQHRSPRRARRLSIGLAAALIVSVAPVQFASAADPGNPNTTTTIAPAPNPPQNVRVEIAGRGSLRFLWIAPVPNGSVIVRYSLIQTATRQVVDIASNQTQVVIGGLNETQTYNFTLLAVGADGVASAPVSIGPITFVQTPNAPRDLFAQITGPDRATVGWSAPTGTVPLGSYQVATSTGIVINVPPSQTSTTIAGLLPGQPFTINVKAVSTTGGASVAVVTEALNLGQAPIAPRPVTATAVSADRVTVAWQIDRPKVGVSRFEISVIQDQRVIATHNATGDARQFTVINLVPGSYSFAVRVIGVNNVNSDSTGSNVVTLASPTPVPPTNPVNVTALAADASTIVVSWQVAANNNPVSGYRITASNGTVVTVPAGQLQARFAGLAPGTYTCTVQAIGLDGALSAQSVAAGVVLSPQVQPPSTPTTIRVYYVTELQPVRKCTRNKRTRRLTCKTVQQKVRVKVIERG